MYSILIFRLDFFMLVGLVNGQVHSQEIHTFRAKLLLS